MWKILHPSQRRRSANLPTRGFPPLAAPLRLDPVAAFLVARGRRKTPLAPGFGGFSRFKLQGSMAQHAADFIDWRAAIAGSEGGAHRKTYRLPPQSVPWLIGQTRFIGQPAILLPAYERSTCPMCPMLLYIRVIATNAAGGSRGGVPPEFVSEFHGRIGHIGRRASYGRMEMTGDALVSLIFRAVGFSGLPNIAHTSQRPCSSPRLRTPR